MRPLYVAALGALIGGAIALPAWAEPGLILMRLRGHELNNVGKPIDGIALSSYTLMNLETKKLVWWTSTGRVLVVEADPGIYCLFSVAYENLQSQYCGEPYFRVVGGKINNLGQWRYGFYFAENAVKLLSSFEKLDETLSEAVGYDVELVRKYGYVKP